MEWWWYWWLIFPVGGAVFTWVRRAAAVRERSLDRRHQREIELIRARQLAGPLDSPAAPATPATESPSTQLERLFAAHDDVTARWLEYELDVGKTIAFPAMSDGRQPLTAAFLRAKRVADRLRPDSPARVTREQLIEYRDAVTDYEVAFDLAERDARRIKDSAFAPDERKRLDTAQRLLAVAVDEAATPAERQVAYRRVREELDGLLSLSDGAVEVLEKRVALELAARARPDAAGAPHTADETVDAEPSPLPGALPTAPHSVPPRPTKIPPARDTTPPGRVIRPKPRA